MLQAVLDALYPPKCALCGQLGAEAICTVCDSGMVRREDGTEIDERYHPLDWVLVAATYEGRARQAVLRLKFDRVRTLAPAMAARMRETISRAGLGRPDALIPVPIHWRRECWRGFNQAEDLAHSLGHPVETEWLERTRFTAPQARLTLDERRENLDGAFRASPDVAGLDLWLIDDVLTSGRTAVECARALKLAGCSTVGAIVFASGGSIPEAGPPT